VLLQQQTAEPVFEAVDQVERRAIDSGEVHADAADLVFAFQAKEMRVRSAR
jgi:hypothetical protein